MLGRVGAWMEVVGWHGCRWWDGMDGGGGMAWMEVVGWHGCRWWDGMDGGGGMAWM